MLTPIRVRGGAVISASHSTNQQTHSIITRPPERCRQHRKQKPQPSWPGHSTAAAEASTWTARPAHFISRLVVSGQPLSMLIRAMLTTRNVTSSRTRKHQPKNLMIPFPINQVCVGALELWAMAAYFLRSTRDCKNPKISIRNLSHGVIFCGSADSCAAGFCGSCAGSVGLTGG